MPASIGVNLRVTGHCRQGGRKYMEDFFSVAYQQTEDEKDLEYAFFGIYDGHGGAEAAAFAKEHLMETIIKHKNFWSDDDEDVLRAIKDGYIATHYAMWREQEKWPRTASGLPSTAGTTASVAFIRRGKIYIGHVGDSGIILGYQEPGSTEWKAKPLTRDHKPENAEEMSRITSCGGKVIAKSGVPRVVWNRPKIGHQGPVRRSTPIDEIPFLAVARSLGDLWSFNSQINQFIVSPDPDCMVFKIDTNAHRCLIFGTDGLYNMLSPSMAVHIVQHAERHNENAALSDSTYKTWMNPSKLLVEKALERWHATKMRADNTSVVTLMLDPPGPPRAQVLKDRKKNLPERGLEIMTRFDHSQAQEDNCANCDNASEKSPNEPNAQTSLEAINSEVAHPEPNLLVAPAPEPCLEVPQDRPGEDAAEPLAGPPPAETASVSSSDLMLNYPLKERNFVPKLRESTSFDVREPLPRNLVDDDGKENQKSEGSEDNTIQCNEVSSSNIELDSTCIEDEPSEIVDDDKFEKPNLRSSKKEKGGALKVKEEKVKSLKRKREPESPQVRKSVRIDQYQKKTSENDRKAFKAEERLKKLAERADQAKKSVVPVKSRKEAHKKGVSLVPGKVKNMPLVKTCKKQWDRNIKGRVLTRLRPHKQNVTRENKARKEEKCKDVKKRLLEVPKNNLAKAKIISVNAVPKPSKKEIVEVANDKNSSGSARDKRMLRKSDQLSSNCSQGSSTRLNVKIGSKVKNGGFSRKPQKRILRKSVVKK